MSKQEIPLEAVEAAYALLPDEALQHINKARLAAILEATAPHMLGRKLAGDVELIAPDVKRVGDTISYDGHLYIRHASAEQLPTLHNTL